MTHLTLDTQDAGVWAGLAPYLSLSDIQALASTCKLMNKTLDKLDVLWQPFLNQLHTIDETISVKPKQGQTIKAAFIAGLEKVRTRQLAEISYLHEKYRYNIFAHCPHINNIYLEQALNLSDVVAISAELDAINSAIITNRIEQTKNAGENDLRLEHKGITRFPKALLDNPAHAAFWRDLQSLRLQDNFLQTLPSNIGNNLQALLALFCENNQLTTLPESIGKLQALQVLFCDNNQLTTLPESIGNLQVLQGLGCNNNQLTTLPESIGNLQMLIHLRCDNNQLTALPESIGKVQALQNLWCYDNQLTALPESIGKLQALHKLWCYDNQLTALPESIGNLQVTVWLRCYNNQLTVLPAALKDKFGEEWVRKILSSQRPIDNQPGNPPVEDNAPTVLHKRQLDTDRHKAKRQRISQREINALRVDERWQPEDGKRHSKGKQSAAKRQK
ncbi:MAG: leucine-rich repeat domain-containing protein [Proteobacteria bacterium]|nr:leucine-rich repeat domain-containing protein [Pseudomonadota bacterium]